MGAQSAEGRGQKRCHPMRRVTHIARAPLIRLRHLLPTAMNPRRGGGYSLFVPREGRRSGVRSSLAVGGARSIAPGFSRVKDASRESSPRSGRQIHVYNAACRPLHGLNSICAVSTRLKPGAIDLGPPTAAPELNAPLLELEEMPQLQAFSRRERLALLPVFCALRSALCPL